MDAWTECKQTVRRSQLTIEFVIEEGGRLYIYRYIYIQYIDSQQIPTKLELASLNTLHAANITEVNELKQDTNQKIKH